MNAKSVSNSISNKFFQLALQLRYAPIPKKIVFDAKKRPDFFATGVASRLPKAYFDWNRPYASVPNLHWRDPGVDWFIDTRTGERRRTDRTPIPVEYPPESQFGLWGGEGFIQGQRKTQPKKKLGGPRAKKIWRPHIIVVHFYSEILDRRLELKTTSRVLDLVDAAYGFDFYILKREPEEIAWTESGQARHFHATLINECSEDFINMYRRTDHKTPREELNSWVGMVLKRQMLLQLGNPDSLYPNDEEKKRKILYRYRHFIIPREEAEWVALTPWDAVEKQKKIEAAENPELPLKDVYTQQLIEELLEEESVFQMSTGESPEDRSEPFYSKLFRRGKSTGSDDGSPV